MVRLRIATWNLDHAYNSNRPVDLQLSYINKFAPDIIVLTETCDKVNLTAYGYNVIYPKLKNIYGKYWSSIWYKNDIHLIKELDTENNEVSVCGHFDTAYGDILIYGTIIAYRDYNVSKGLQPWEEHYKSIEWHGKDWRRITAEHPRIPLVVAGDFNQSRDGSNRYSSPRGLSLLGAELEASNLLCLTEENFGLSGKLSADPKKGYARSNIDHICITSSAFKNITVGAWNHFNEDGIYMSDHNAVFIDVT